MLTDLRHLTELNLLATQSVLLALTMLGIAIGFYLSRQGGQRNAQRLIAELAGLRGETQQIRSHLASLELRLEDRVQLAVASVSTGQKGYELALKMARNGATAFELTAASGVTHNEALLLARLHNPRPN
jgi:hypothetical protein